MTEPVKDTIERLEAQLAGAERTLEDLREQLRKRMVEELSPEFATRISDHVERLHSQLLAVTEPPSLADAHDRLGLDPATEDEFDALRSQMAAPDGEG